MAIIGAIIGLVTAAQGWQGKQYTPRSEWSIN